jgi:hypothetical protein
MGRLALLLDQNNKESIRLMTPSYLTIDRVKELNDFLENNNKSLESSYVETLSNYLLQMNGYFNQLIIHGAEIINQDEQEKYKTKSRLLEEREKNKTKVNLEEVVKEYFLLYENVNKTLRESINTNDEKKELAQLVSTANDLFMEIDRAYVESDTKLDNDLLLIAELYKKALSEQKNLQLTTLTKLINEEKRLLANDKENKAIEVATTKQKEFNIFDKINNKIVDKEFKQVNNLVYAKYKLDDGSNYYSVIPDGNKVLTEDKEFKTFTSFEMNKVKIEENLKIIVNNIMIYYDLKEYTRYVEQLYKGKMIGNINQAIEKYKSRLMTMENILKGQLTFMDDIAPILNRKSSSKYPNIVYNDVLVKDFYPNEVTDATLDEKIKLQHKLMIKLADDTISNNITSKEAMLTIYGNDIIDKLTNEFSIPSDDVVKKVPVANNNSEKEMTDNQMITNYQKISDYLKIRKTQLEEVAKGNSDIAITEKDDLIYQNVNTIFDLNIAAIISDNQYSSGQGIYAISQYLKTGEANRFTSSSNARTLASTVKPNNYTSLLMENMIKSFAGSGKKSSEDATYLDRMQQVLSFVKEELSKDVFSANDMKEKLLNNDNLLGIAVKNFDYDYLDPTSENSKLFEQAIEIGINNNNPSAVRIRQALTDIKSIAKVPLENVAQQGQTFVA